MSEGLKRAHKIADPRRVVYVYISFVGGAVCGGWRAERLDMMMYDVGGVGCCC